MLEMLQMVSTKSILLLMLTIVSLFYVLIQVSNRWYSIENSTRNNLQISLLTGTNVTLLYVLTGYVTNAGDELLYINETDIMLFEYPLETDDQKILKIQPFVNNIEYNYSVVELNNNKYVLINSPYYNSTLKPGESINVSVRYYVSINMSRRISNIIDFYFVSDPYELVSIAGSWDDLAEFVNETTTGLTNLWNYTNPLVKLLVKYLNETISSARPLTYLLTTLDWIDNNIVYSTRIPPRAPWEVIVEGAGDCDDQSNLLITVLRAFGIPSFLEIGIVYVAEDYYVKRTESHGHYSYEFIGGGGHGWVAVYIPPWGWIRVDPIIRVDPLTNERAPLHRVAIKYALFYIHPTIVLSRVFGENYVEESVRFLEEIRTRKLIIHLVIEVYKLSES